MHTLEFVSCTLLSLNTKRNMLTCQIALPTGSHTIGAPLESTHTPQKDYPPTPIKFPRFEPQATSQELQGDSPLVALLQKIQRPADIKAHHFSALGIHITSDCSPATLIPEASFLPPAEEWSAVSREDWEGLNESTQRPLSNGRLSPGIKTYCERLNELQIDNLAAFRTIRRIPAPTGETPARLGNAYEFYKNLELFSGYWPDTSLECAPEIDDSIPTHQQTHMRTGTGSQLPPDYRQHLLSAFVKLVAYDFGCNVSFPRTEPRLHLTPPGPAPPSYFNSSVTFIYRTPTDRISARGGFVEGPVAALSSRNTTGFATEEDEQLDLAREVVAVLLTAQLRARENKVERRFGEGKWWSSKQRWGGGSGGPIGKEGERMEAIAALAFSKENQASTTPTPASSTSTITPPSTSVPKPTPTPAPQATNADSKVVSESKRQLSSISSPLPSSYHNTHTPGSPSASGKPSSKRSKKDSGHMPAYDLYRKILPPAPTWDRKARYSAIGSVPHADYDDIFLVCALNHHISILRARVPLFLLHELSSEKGAKGEEGVRMYRSKWFDMFIGKERVEAMGIVWGMMAWLMRKVEVKPEVPSPVVHTHLPHSRHDTHASATAMSNNATEASKPVAGGNEDAGDKMDLSQ